MILGFSWFGCGEPLVFKPETSQEQVLNLSLFGRVSNFSRRSKGVKFQPPSPSGVFFVKLPLFWCHVGFREKVTLLQEKSIKTRNHQHDLQEIGLMSLSHHIPRAYKNIKSLDFSKKEPDICHSYYTSCA